MQMKGQERELFRLALLRVLEANQTRFGLGAAALAHLASMYGFARLTEEQVWREIQYLEDKGQVAGVDKAISPENRVWRITACGRDYLAGVANG